MHARWTRRPLPTMAWLLAVGLGAHVAGSEAAGRSPPDPRAGTSAAAAAIGMVAAEPPLAPPPAAAATDGTDTADRARAILEEGGYQTELPGRPRAAPTPAPRRRTATGPPAPLSEVLLVLLGAAALAALVVVVARSWGPPAEAEPRPAERDAGRAPEVVGGARADAGALAASGRFGEAVHALMLQVLSDIVRQGRPLPEALTAREAVEAAGLPEDRTAALAELVATSEAAVFAGRDLSEHDWERCRAVAARLTGAPAGGDAGPAS